MSDMFLGGGIFLIAGVGLGGGFWMRRALRRLLSEKESILQAWRLLEMTISQRNARLTEMMGTIEETLPQEGALVSALNASRERSQTQLLEGDIQKLSETERGILEHVRDLRRLIETAGGEGLTPLASELAAMEERVCEERERYNLAVNQFNRSLKRFPDGLLAMAFRLKERDYLEARRYAR